MTHADTSRSGPDAGCHPEPVSAGMRVQSLDALRGFALLGILVPNILWFAWPQAGAVSPEAMAEVAQSVSGPDVVVHEAANKLGFMITDIFFLGKFMFLFATLFGAGVLFFDRKFHKPGQAAPLSRGARLWYARMGWMLVIGLLHAFGVWFGDILVWYAMGGLGLVWWVRRLRPQTLIACGVGSYLLGLLVILALTILAESAVRQGTMTPNDLWGGDPLVEYDIFMHGSYADMVWWRIRSLAFLYLLTPLTFFWEVSGMMMVGLALARMGIYTGQRSTRTYAGMALIGIPLGLATTLAGWWAVRQLHSPIEAMYWMNLAQICGVPAALGYAGLVLLLVRAGVLKPLTGALAAVGRMALSNYLLQSILCTTFFYGYGLGYFAKLQYPELFLVIGCVWMVNIIFSAMWLRVFRFGPAEWVWRSLTYWRLQPMLR